MGSPEWRQKVDDIYKSFVGEEGKRWARPEAPILNDLPDEKAEPHVFFHNTNYRISRKYINVEKVKVSCLPAKVCMHASSRRGLPWELMDALTARDGPYAHLRISFGALWARSAAIIPRHHLLMLGSLCVRRF